jgi:hypothetical protein
VFFFLLYVDEAEQVDFQDVDKSFVVFSARVVKRRKKERKEKNEKGGLLSFVACFSP